MKQIIDSQDLQTKTIAKASGNEEVCELHGEPIKYYNHVTNHKACIVCKHRDLFLRKVKESSEKIYELLSDTNTPLRFRNARFDDYKAYNQKQEIIKDILWQFVKGWKTQLNNTGFILLGGNGTGKTHLSCALINSMTIATKFNCYYTEAIKIVRRIKDGWREKESEIEIMKKFSDNPYLLIIDEVGVQFGSDTERQYLTEIINDRYNQCQPTILIGNLTLKELANTLGDRIIDRYREDGKVLIFDWESYRGKNLKG